MPIKKRKFIHVWVFLVLFNFYFLINPCSTFVLQKGNNFLFGRNYDFFTPMGYVMINHANVSKTALVFPGENAAQWISQYGSITFNQVGCEFPMGGMNQKGLVVENMWLNESVFPEKDERAALSELQWIQYQLDNCATVDEVLATDVKIRISNPMSTIHFLICDVTGKTAVVEFLGGKMVSYIGKDLPVKVLTNNTYASSLDYCKNLKKEAKIKTPGNPTSFERFAYLSVGVNKSLSKKNQKLVKRAFGLLWDVSYRLKDAFTCWSIVYDPVNLAIHFRTVSNANIKSISFDDFQLSCGSPRKVYNLESTQAKAVFEEYSPALNESLTRGTFARYKKENFLKDLPEIAIKLVAAYPQTTRCNK